MKKFLIVLLMGISLSQVSFATSVRPPESKRPACELIAALLGDTTAIPLNLAALFNFTKTAVWKSLENDGDEYFADNVVPSLPKVEKITKFVEEINEELIKFLELAASNKLSPARVFSFLSEYATTSAEIFPSAILAFPVHMEKLEKRLNEASAFVEAETVMLGALAASGGKWEQVDQDAFAVRAKKAMASFSDDELEDFTSKLLDPNLNNVIKDLGRFQAKSKVYGAALALLFKILEAKDEDFERFEASFKDSLEKIRIQLFAIASQVMTEYQPSKPNEVTEGVRSAPVPMKGGGLRSGSRDDSESEPFGTTLPERPSGLNSGSP